MVHWLKEQINLFLLTVGFFTRIPIPKNTPYSDELLNHTTRFYGIIGIFIGLINYLALITLCFYLPKELAFTLAIAFSLYLTGAFHEDGLADMVDGFGGGFTPEKKLNIMKDSRQGTYGVSALIITILLYFFSYKYLTQFGSIVTLFAIVIGHTISRVMAGTLIASLPYLRALDTAAKAKPLATKLRKSDLSIMLLSGIALMLLFTPLYALIFFGICIFLHFILKGYLTHHLGGYTGDCLGAAQIITMFITWIFIIALLHNGIIPFYIV